MKKILIYVLITVLVMSVTQTNYKVMAEESDSVIKEPEVKVSTNTLTKSFTIINGDEIEAKFVFDGGAGDPNRIVRIMIPRGLRLVRATGLETNLANGKMNPVTLTEEQAIAWKQPVASDIKQDAKPQADGIEYLYTNAASGTITYHLNQNVSGGEIKIVFAADELLYDYSNNHEIGSIVATITGTDIDGKPNTDTSSTAFTIAPDHSDPIYSLTGSSTTELNKLSPMKFELIEDTPLGGTANNESVLPIYQVSFKLTYPTGAKPAVVSGYTNSKEVDNGNGTSYVIVTKDTSINLTNGKIAINNFWKDGGVTYPKDDSRFIVGNKYTATISDLTWKTLSVDADGNIGSTYHYAKGSQSVETELTEIPSFDPYYKNQSSDWEAYYTEDCSDVKLAETHNAVRVNAGTSYSPVQFRVDCDYIKDHVNKIELFVPPLTPGNSTITKVVYKYTDEAEVIWENTDSTPMPGVIKNNQWAQAGSNNNYITLTAEDGNHFEYAYVQVDQIYTYGNEGHNNAVYGLPITTTPGGEYSNHVFSTLQYNEVTKEFEEKATTNPGSGFRWKVPNNFKLIDYSRDGMEVKYAGNATADHVSLAKFAYVNESGTTSDNPIEWKLECDTTNDKTSTVWFPLPYTTDIDTSKELVTSIQWTYEGDQTIYEWSKDRDGEFPFETGKVTLNDNNANISVTNKPFANYGVLNTVEGKYISTVNVVYKSWASNASGAFANVWGRPVSVDRNAPKSQHKATLSTLNADGSVKDELFSKKQGFKWGVLTDVQVRTFGNFNGGDNSTEGPTLTNVDLNAGSVETLKFSLVGNPLPQMTFALILPKDIVPDISSFQWRFQKATGFAEQERIIGATLVSQREATPEDLELSGYSIEDEAKVYVFNATNQDAATNYASGGKRYYSYVTFNVHISPLASTRVIQWSQMTYIATNQEDLELGLIAKTENAVATTALEGLGKSNTIIGDRTRTITIHRSPKLYIDNFIKNESGDYHAYTNDPEDIVSFGPNERGTIKVELTNTVDDKDIDEYDNYVFIPIGDDTSLSQESGFDLQLAGTPIVNTDVSEMEGYEIRYLSVPNSQIIDASNAVKLYDDVSTTSYDSTTNFVVVKLDHLQQGKSVEVEVPIKAPSNRSDGTVYNQFCAISVYYYKGSNRTVFHTGNQGNGSLRICYYNDAYTVNFVSNNGDPIESQQILEKDKIVQPNDPTRYGYTFEGWYLDDETFKNKYDFGALVTQDTTLYAKWTEIPSIIVTYEIDSLLGGTLSKEYESLRPVTGNAIGSVVTMNPGYTFEGWYEGETLISSELSFIPTKNKDGMYEARTYTAHIVLNKDTAYCVKVYLEDFPTSKYIEDTSRLLIGIGTTDSSATYTKPTITGFTNESSKTTYETTNQAASTTELKIAGDGSLIVRLYYSRNQHSVTYQYVGTVPTGAPSVPIRDDVVFGDTFSVDATISTEPGKAVVGYTFSGWSQTGDVTMSDADIVLEGTWIENGDTPYSVEHYLQKNDGTYATAKDTDHLTGKTNASVTAVSKTYTGYHFDATTSVNEGTIAGDGSLVLKLYYTQNAYEIKFNANSTTVTGSMDAQAMKYDTPAKLNGNEFTNPGYKFLGWSLTQSSTTPDFVDQEEVKQLSATNGATITLYAVWQKEESEELPSQNNKPIEPTNPESSKQPTISDKDTSSMNTPDTGDCSTNFWDVFMIMSSFSVLVFTFLFKKKHSN